MRKLTRAMAAARRGAARLVPAGRRDWVQAVWAEASEVPSGLGRLAWLAGGIRVIYGEAPMARRIGRLLLFAVAAAVAAWATWPGSPARFSTLLARVDVVTIVLLMAGLPLLAGWFLGPASDGWLARVLRVCGYAAVLALTVAKPASGGSRTHTQVSARRIRLPGSSRSFSWSSWPGTWRPSWP